MRTALVVVALLASRAASADPPPAINDAIDASVAAKLPLVLEFGASWCGPCKQFDQDVLADANVQAALKQVVFVHYDAEVSPGLEAAARFGVEAYPTFLVVDKRGIEVSRRRGAPDTQSFIELVTTAKDQAVDEAEIRADLRAHLNDPAARLRAGRWFASLRNPGEALTNYTAVLKARTATAAERNEATAACEHLKRIDVWRHDLVADKVAAAKAAPATVALDDLAIATIDSALDPKDIKALLATALAAQTDAARANGMIYIALAAGANDEALATAERLLAPTKQAQFLDTLAECFHIRGARDQALATEDEALKAATGGALEQMLKRNRVRFDTGTGDSGEVVQLRARVAELWKRLETVDQLPTQTPNPASSQLTAYALQRLLAAKKADDADHALAVAIAQKCTRWIGAAKLALVSIDLSPAGHLTNFAILIDDGASTKLRPCIERELGNAALPVADRHRREIRIDLKP